MVTRSAGGTSGAITATSANISGDAATADPGQVERALGDRIDLLIDTGASPAWVTAADEESTRRPFGNGEAVFLRSWPYAVDLFERPDSPVRGKVGLAPLPRYEAGVPAPGSTGGAHLAITRHTRHPAEAIERAARDSRAALVATLKSVADRLTQYQDAAALEGYLATARGAGLARETGPRTSTRVWSMSSASMSAILPETLDVMWRKGRTR